MKICAAASLPFVFLGCQDFNPFPWYLTSSTSCRHLLERFQGTCGRARLVATRRATAHDVTDPAMDTTLVERRLEVGVLSIDAWHDVTGGAPADELRQSRAGPASAFAPLVPCDARPRPRLNRHSHDATAG
jgi:hypothetical protein